MLRLDLKDADDTVLFVNPVNGIEIRKITDRFSVGEQEKSGLRIVFATCGSCELMTAIAWYGSSESRDTAYKYVLAKINEYLFPQIEKDIDIQVKLEKGDEPTPWSFVDNPNYSSLDSESKEYSLFCDGCGITIHRYWDNFFKHCPYCGKKHTFGKEE